MDNIMLDLETMGNKSDSAIIAIGAVAFDLENKQLGKEFYVVVDLQSAVDNGGVIYPSTVLWWMQQSDEARSAFERKGENIYYALEKFTRFVNSISNPKDVKIWGNGVAFDNVILGDAYDKIGVDRPWMFWNDRCYRTIKNQYPDTQMNRVGTHHNALEDAKSQALHLMEMIGG